MDLLSFVKHGVTLAGNPEQRFAQERAERDLQRRRDVVAKARALWRNALTVDETRGWLSMLERNTEVLSGLCIVLSMVAFAQAVDTNEEDPTVRVIRGALSAIEQAGKANAVITHELLVAVSSATRMACQTVDTCSDDAIEHAAHYMHSLVHLQGPK